MNGEKTAELGCVGKRSGEITNLRYAQGQKARPYRHAPLSLPLQPVRELNCEKARKRSYLRTIAHITRISLSRRELFLQRSKPINFTKHSMLQQAKLKVRYAHTEQASQLGILHEQDAAQYLHQYQGQHLSQEQQVYLQHCAAEGMHRSWEAAEVAVVKRHRKMQPFSTAARCHRR